MCLMLMDLLVRLGADVGIRTTGVKRFGIVDSTPSVVAVIMAAVVAAVVVAAVVPAVAVAAVVAAVVVAAVVVAAVVVAAVIVAAVVVVVAAAVAVASIGCGSVLAVSSSFLGSPRHCNSPSEFLIVNNPLKTKCQEILVCCTDKSD